MLVANYYNIQERRISQDAGYFRVALRPDCEVYQGHFPGEPVCPGVCNIQMIKECVEEMAQKRCRLTAIQQCRLTTLVTPVLHPEAEVKIQVTGEAGGTQKIRATIGKGEEIYLDLKAEVSYINN